MWINRKKWDAIQEELAALRTKVAVADAVSKLCAPVIPGVTIDTAFPEKQPSKPIDEAKAQRIRDLFDSEKGTKWQRTKRAAEKALRETQPTEVVINTPATQEK